MQVNRMLGSIVLKLMIRRIIVIKLLDSLLDSRSCSSCISTAPGIATTRSRVWAPHHCYPARAVPQNGCNHLMTLNVFFGLLTPDEPVPVHLMSIAHHEAGASLQALRVEERTSTGTDQHACFRQFISFQAEGNTSCEHFMS